MSEHGPTGDGPARDRTWIAPSADDVLGELRAELSAARDEVALAATQIIIAADSVLDEASPQVAEALTTILTSCGFADLVGQRLAKIHRALSELGPGDLPRAGAMGAASAQASLLNGPALHGPEVPQQQIDELFG